MATPSRRRLVRVTLPPPGALYPDALDETVVHDPSGRPWLVCTTDRLYGRHDRPDLEGDAALAPDGSEGPNDLDGPSALDPAWRRYETQIYYTARAGIRGFPTGHGQRHANREEAIACHRQWCLRVRTGDVLPDRPPDDPLET